MGNKTKAYRGFEQKEISIKMWAKMVMKTGLIVWGCYSVVFVMFAQQIMPKLCHPEVLQYIKIWFSALGHGVLHWGWSKATVDWIDGSKVTIRYVMDNINGLAWLKKVSAHYGFWLGAAEAVGIPLGVLYFWWEDRKNSQPEHRRGAKILKPKQLARQIKKKYGKGDIPLSQEITLPKSLETRHTFIIGGTGTGKTTTLNNVLTKLKERGEKAVVFDLKGDFLTKFWKEGDLILNPLDARSVKWSILNDLRNTREAFDLARSFIPSSAGSGTEQYFRDAARDVLGCVMAILWSRRELDNAKIWDIISGSTKNLLRFLLSHDEGRIGAAHIEQYDSDQAAGVRSTLLQFGRIFKELRCIDGDFSLREWIKRDGAGFLFLPVPPVYREILSPIHSAAVNMMIKEMLNLPDDLNRRRFFLLDELGALQKLNSLIDGLTLGRSKGMSFFLGTQDFGRIDIMYGRQMRDTIWNNSVSKVILRVDAPDVSKYLADHIGQAELEISTQSHSMGVKDGRDGMSLGRQIQVQQVMLPSEIQAIPDLTAVIKVAELNPCYPCKIERKEIASAGIPAFVEAQMEPTEQQVEKPVEVEDSEKIEPKPEPEEQKKEPEKPPVEPAVEPKNEPEKIEEVEDKKEKIEPEIEENFEDVEPDFEPDFQEKIEDTEDMVEEQNEGQNDQGNDQVEPVSGPPLFVMYD